ncbi:MAG: trigger factor [Candidatus Doudnabacteria bacterium]|nr:trigger factor [Candidatus Doudnabacteria bacterium]
MKIEKNNLPDGAIELTVRVAKSEAVPMLTQAASRMSLKKTIKGFRPGRAPLEIVKREFGEEAVLAEALEEIVDETLGKILEDEKLRPYGQVGFKLLPSQSPDEAAAYKASFTLLPEVALGDWTKNKLRAKESVVNDDELAKAMEELAQMSGKETEVTDRAVEKNDKVLVDFEVKVEGKIIDGGTATDFPLVIGEGRMIPGFEDKLIGTTANQKLEFKLSFPKDYHAELAGKEAEFTVTVKKILTTIKPAIDEEFAKKLGLENLDQLKSKIRENLKHEKDQQEAERLEIAAIKQVVETSKIGTIPAVMVADTVKELVHDFEHTLAHQGMSMEQYLKTTNKTLEDIKKDFEPKALERIKSSLVLEELAVAEKLTINTAEIEEEIEAQRRHFAQRPEVLNDLKQPEYRRHIANTLLNRKLIKLIKDKIVE